MSLFANVDINNAKTTGGVAHPLPAGDYVLKVVSTKGFISRKKESCYEVLFSVVESTNPDKAVGSTANEFNMLTGSASEYGPGRVKTILAVMTGLDTASSADADLIAGEDWNSIGETSITNENLFAGRLVKCSVVIANKKTKKGETYERRTYSPHPSVREKTLALLRPAGKK